MIVLAAGAQSLARLMQTDRTVQAGSSARRPPGAARRGGDGEPRRAN